MAHGKQHKNDSECLLSYALDGQGGAEHVDAHSMTSEDTRLIWVHLNARHPETKTFLRDNAGLDPLLIKPLVAEETRPRMEELVYGTMIILRGINFNPGPDPEDLVSIRIWISGNRIITLGRRKSAAIAEMDARIQQHRAPRSVGEFVATLCNALNESVEPAITELEEEIDTLEEASINAPETGLRANLSTVRKQATLFRRHLSPQRDVINGLRITDQNWLSASDKWIIQESYDRVTRFIEELDATRERAQILQDELYSAQSSKLNGNLYILSVITVIFMPLTFITGLLGMNVDGIPGAHHPHAFAAVCGIALVIGAVQLLIFRRLKWF